VPCETIERGVRKRTDCRAHGGARVDGNDDAALELEGEGGGAVLWLQLLHGALPKRVHLHDSSKGQGVLSLSGVSWRGERAGAHVGYGWKRERGRVELLGRERRVLDIAASK